MSRVYALICACLCVLSFVSLAILVVCLLFHVFVCLFVCLFILCYLSFILILLRLNDVICGDQDDHNVVLLFLLCSKKEIIKLRFSRRIETTFTVFEDVINKQQQLED